MFRKLLAAFLLLTVGSAGCSPSPSGDTDSVTLTLAAYTAPREAYGEIIPLFQTYWLEKTGQTVHFEESYQGSGTQSRAVVEGFEADVVALSLEADLARIEHAGLITHDWKSRPHGGMVSTSIVALAVRPGNPMQVHDWADLSEPGIGILTPNPKTSGGAMWNVLAIYGAAKRGHVEGVQGGDDEAAQKFLLSVLRNVTVMDKAARESITNFEKGIGDVAITYENEILVGQHAGGHYELVIPSSTIRVDNPVAVVDAYVDRHGTREAAESFVDFLFTKEVQDIFARHGLRSPDQIVAEATKSTYPPVSDLFTIEYFGGWEEAIPGFFGENGVYTLTIAQIQGTGD